MKPVKAASILLVALAVSVALAQGPTQFHPGFNLFSKEQDIQLGQENAAQVRRHMTLLHNPYLNERDARWELPGQFQ